MVRFTLPGRWLLAAVALAYAGQAMARSITGHSVLVVLNKAEERSEFSQFFGGLEERGFHMTFQTAADTADNLQLIKFGERRFDHLVLFADQAKKFPAALNAKELVSFVSTGGNVLLAAGTTIPEGLRSFAMQFGVFYEERDTQVIDHFGFDRALDTDGHHTVLTATEPTTQPASLTRFLGMPSGSGPVLYEGIGHAQSVNPMLSRVLSASPTAYSAEPNPRQVVDEEPAATGQEIGLVSVFQARNNARVAFTGSRRLFSDQFLDAKIDATTPSGNRLFVEQLSKWTMQETGVLRVIRSHHYKTEAPQLTNADAYRMNDNITYSIAIAEYNGDQWQPFEAEDVQLEAIMLDPYLRTKLTRQQESAKSSQVSHDPAVAAAVFSKQFQWPDVFGVYTLRVLHQRAGYSWIDQSDVVPVRPYRHDEYERFLTVAYPYYTGAGSVMVAFLVICALWLYTKPDAPATLTAESTPADAQDAKKQQKKSKN